MSNENKGVSILSKLAGALHVSLETFITIVSVIFVVGFACLFFKNMFFANDVKDIYMNWQDIIYVSDHYDEKRNDYVVSVTIESLRGFPKPITVSYADISASEACPIIINDSVTVPTMMGDTLVLPSYFDSVYGFVRAYHEKLKEED